MKFTHFTKKSNQRCFPAIWWPTKEVSAGAIEKEYPLMLFESGQCNRVKKDNLQRITHAT